MKVLIIGSNGMAGHLISDYLTLTGHDVETAARNNSTFIVDIADTKTTKQFLTEIKDRYDFIINCAGLLVKDSTEHPDRAAIVNSWFPHAVEQEIKNSKTRLVHLSTDCVFDGSKGNYTELDHHSEMNFYGRSKSFGEVNNNKDITFRMSIIGPEIKKDGSGLFNWIYKNSESKIPGWTNALWNGITTLELARCIDSYIEQPTISGVYHLVNNTPINKFDLLSLINQIFDLNKEIVPMLGPKNINKVLVDTRKEFNFNIPSYQEMIYNQKLYMEDNVNRYNTLNEGNHGKS